MEREIRHSELKKELEGLHIPPGVYLPLCSSTDPWITVRRVLPAESHAFSTKARCPALVLFESEIHPLQFDVANYLAKEFLDRVDGSGVSGSNIDGSSSVRISTKSVSIFDEDSISGVSSTRSGGVWSAEGVGMRRVKSSLMNEGLNDVLTTVEPASESIPEPSKDHTSTGPSIADRLSVSFDGLNGSHSSVFSPSTFGETFSKKAERVRSLSPLADLRGWVLQGLIAKSNDDLRQEVLVMQLITYYQRIFTQANLPLWVYSYRILSTSKSTGLIQLIPDAISLDGLKKRSDWAGSLRAHFERAYNGPDSTEFHTAVREYSKSLAGYSVVTYLLAIKDR